jgi:hypothetical protein
MLVAVALVVLMMSLFATIFQFATQAMAVQKGTAENDQKVRLVMTLLRGDLDGRTTKLILPHKASDALEADYRSGDRIGYFYISENDPDDDTDDVLQMTVRSSDLFYGRAKLIQGTGGLTVDPNQPEFDDAMSGTNDVGASTTAEVAYFLRGGTLYRRVLLVRQPIIPTGTVDGTPKLGSNGTGTAILMTEYANGTRNFGTDFDYSAFPTAQPNPNPPLLTFHGTNDMANNTGATTALGRPNCRFGHNYLDGLPREYTTRHYDMNGTLVGRVKFLGRFTQEETSFIDSTKTPALFGYPGRIAPTTAPSPYQGGFSTVVGITQLTYDMRTNKIAEYAGGSRISEDILMTGVHRFDIKVFDEGAWYGPDGYPGVAFGPGPDNIMGTGDDVPFDDDNNGTANDISELGYPGSDDGDFRDVGHVGFKPGPPAGTGPDLAFYSASKLNPATVNYCPNQEIKTSLPAIRVRQHRFDSWHPNVNLGLGLAKPPPYRAPDIVGPPTGIDARRPLSAVKITISFFDQTSQQMRDVTLVHNVNPDR